MASDDILKGKKILAVDDEPDILDTLLAVMKPASIRPSIVRPPGPGAGRWRA